MAVRCKDCARDAAPGKSRCDGCASTHCTREAARKEARRQGGLCVYCGKKAVKGQTLCRKHRAFYEARRVAKKKKKARARRPAPKEQRA